MEAFGKRIFLVFLAYSVLGWCYEVFLEVFVYRWGFSNRGFLFGSYCPVYGFGALLLLFFLLPLKEKRIHWHKIPLSPGFVFLGAMLLATALEVLTSYLLEWATGDWLWDYRGYALQFQGRIALNPGIRFGLGGLLFLYGIQPLLEKIGKSMGEQGCNRLFWAAAIFFGADFFITLLCRFGMVPFS